jgi:hypothetical protein
VAIVAIGDNRRAACRDFPANDPGTWLANTVRVARAIEAQRPLGGEPWIQVGCAQ